MPSAANPAPTPPPLIDVPTAIARLRSGAVVAIPTETVYGLAADALNPEAVARIFAIKGRPANHPLIVHVAGLERLAGWVAPPVPEAALVLAAAFWPGPLTLVLPRGPLAHDVITGGLDTVAVRVPAHPLARALLHDGHLAVAAPSANRYGHISPTTAAHVQAEFGAEVAGVIDGGPAEVGIESTIVDLSGPFPAVLRHGGVPLADIAAVLGVTPVDATVVRDGKVRAPGQVASHYAPRARLEVLPASELDGRAQALAAEGVRVVRLGHEQLGADSDTWARNLYAALRDADAGQPDAILIPEAPPGRLAEGVADRLRRAAATR
jgi:L-threonylcarbamoyladenylate synthase